MKCTVHVIIVLSNYNDPIRPSLPAHINKGIQQSQHASLWISMANQMFQNSRDIQTSVLKFFHELKFFHYYYKCRL